MRSELTTTLTMVELGGYLKIVLFSLLNRSSYKNDYISSTKKNTYKYFFMKAMLGVSPWGTLEWTELDTLYIPWRPRLDHPLCPRVGVLGPLENL
jgi:hypothetical protein